MIETRIVLTGFAVLLFFSNAHAQSSPPVEITVCGQAVARSAFLTGDLDCTGFSGDAVTIKKGALDLAGFTLTAGLQHGFVCERRCTVENGVITGAAIDGIHNAGRKLTLSNVSILSSGRNGVGAPEATSDVRRSRVFVADSLISGSAGRGINAGTAVITNSTISDSGIQGLFITRNVEVAGSNVVDNGNNGVYSERKVFISDSIVTGNGEDGVRGIRGIEAEATDSSSNGQFGMTGRRVRASFSTINNNGLNGVVAGRRIEMADSTICGNAFGDFGFSVDAKFQLAATQCEGKPECLPCP